MDLTLVCRTDKARWQTEQARWVPRKGSTPAHLRPGKAGDFRRAGDWSQCGATATFTALTLTGAADEAVRAGWRVDSPTLGEFSRRDSCPRCTGASGSYDYPLHPLPIPDEAA